MLLIPAIDLRGGQCVRLLQGRFDAETVYADDPLRGARALPGARRAPASTSSTSTARATGRRAIARRSARLVGGAGRDRDPGRRRHPHARRWPTNCSALGVARVVVGSVAVDAARRRSPTGCDELGPERVVLAFDVRLDAERHPAPRHARLGAADRRRSLWDAGRALSCRRACATCCAPTSPATARCPARTWRCTRNALRRFPDIAWQASGGVSTAADLHALAATGVAAVDQRPALLEGRLSRRGARPFLPAA